jgi:drug/metabolite transporter (DMT)-like permease
MRPGFYILITIIFTVGGQLMLKKGMLQVGGIPPNGNADEYIAFFIKALTNFNVILSLFLAFVAALGWIAAISKLNLSYAYPFMASTFAFVLFFSWLIFGEQVSLLRWGGIFVIWVGIFLISRS